MIADGLKARFAVGYSDRDGWGDNLADGRDINSSEDITVRGSLEFTPTAALKINLIGEYLDREARPGTIAVADTVSGNITSPFIKRADFEQLIDANDFALNDPQFTESETVAVTLLANWDLGGVIVDWISGYRSFDMDGAQDSDGTARTLFNNFGTFRNDQYSQEIRLSSPAENRFEWIIGGYYIHEDNAMNPFVINNFNAFFGLGTNADFRAFQDLDAVAVFADVSYEIVKRLTLRLGGRYSYEQKKFENNQAVVTLRAGFFPPAMINLPAGATVVPPTRFTAKDSWEDFSPRVVIDYQIANNMLVYASYSQGFKSGGFNSFGLTPAFNPEDVDAFEIGWKSDLADGRARLNLSAFYYDYADLQVRLGVPTGGVNIQNAAQAEVGGVEVEATVAPVEGLRFDASLAYLDAEFTEGSLPAVPLSVVFPIGAPIPLVNEDIDGNRLSRAPKWQLSLAGEYRMPVSDLGDVRLRLSYFHQSN
ncbi:MAG: TonB-dependent receptor, partial [Alphaproteobacteria bacterium]